LDALLGVVELESLPVALIGVVELEPLLELAVEVVVAPLLIVVAGVLVVATFELCHVTITLTIINFDIKLENFMAFVTD